METICLDCGNAIKGRSDKKFCNDACRNHYNNRLKSEDNFLLKSINQILKQNRSILLKLNPEGKVKMAKSRLLKAGFNFSYHTHHHQTHNGNTYVFCYEQGYLPLNDNELLLVRKEEK
ncbi:hypothetical protein DHW03_17065 [Pedobacter yonginense]|uniref:DUF2116 family Zn-ribbon domain-containing protein n=1 Tax=Pedobacter yonginense TaxID=651869 RepID=A0A317EN58_9SPHI|nr:hypothetical protein [Pedobacter yonginense]PWS26488.1 hypothetical protein DHW03_17065 [Pedobacter yonginense]